MTAQYKSPIKAATAKVKHQIFRSVSFEKKLWIFEKENLEIIKLGVEIIGLISLVATFLTGVWLAFLQRDANRINEQAMRSSHTVWVTHDGWPITVTNVTRPFIDFAFKNVSDTPARHFWADIRVRYQNEDWQPAIRLVGKNQSGEGGETTVFPQEGDVTELLLKAKTQEFFDIDAEINKNAYDVGFHYVDLYNRHIEIHHVYQRVGDRWRLLDQTATYEGY